MQYGELIQLYFERSNSLQSYWTLYVVVIGGLLAFASVRQRPDLLTTGLVTVLFLCFAFRNVGAIHDVSLQRYAVLQMIKADDALLPSLPPARVTMASALQPTSYAAARNFHVLTDALTVLALWAMELRRRRAASGHFPVPGRPVE